MERYQLALAVRMESLRLEEEEGAIPGGLCPPDGESERLKQYRRCTDALVAERELLRKGGRRQQPPGWEEGEDEEDEYPAVDEEGDGGARRPPPRQLAVELYRRGTRRASTDESDDGMELEGEDEPSPPPLRHTSPLLIDRGLPEDESDRVDSAVTLYNMALWHHAFGRGDASRCTALQLLQMALSVSPKFSVDAEANADAAALLCLADALYHEFVTEQLQSRWARARSRAQSRPSEPARWEAAALIHANAGQIYLDFGRPDEALSHLSRAWTSVCRCPGPRGLDLAAMVLSHLGHAHYRRGQMRHSMSACRAMLHLLRPGPDDDAPDVADKQAAAALTLHNMGTIHHRCSQAPQALAQYEAFLSLHEAEDDLRARTLHRVGRILMAAGESGLAVRPLRDAASLTYRLRGTEAHPFLVPVMDTLGNAYLNQGMHTDALRTFRRTLAIAQTCLGRRSVDAATQLCNIGQVYHMGGHLGEAARCYREALDAVEELAEQAQDDDDDDDSGGGGWPASRPSPSDLRSLQVELLNVLGTAYLEAGDVPTASATFREASELEARIQRGGGASTLSSSSSSQGQGRASDGDAEGAGGDNDNDNAASPRARSAPTVGFNISALVFQRFDDGTPPTAPAA